MASSGSGSTASDISDDATAHEDEPMWPTDDDEPEEAYVVRVPHYVPDHAVDNIPTIFRPPPSVARSAIAGSSFARGHASARSGVRRRPCPSILIFDGGADYPITVLDSAGAARLARRRSRAKRMDRYTVQNCCGALACLRIRHGGAGLLNPATGECLHLVHHVRATRSRRDGDGDDDSWYCLGRCRSTGEHKVVRIHTLDRYTTARCVPCEVLAFGHQGGEIAGRQWQEVGVWDMWHRSASRGVHVGGVVYYLTGHSHEDFVVCFDLSTYQVRRINLPETYLMADELCELDGRLCVTVVPEREKYVSSSMYVWVLDGAGDGDGQHGGEALVLRFRLPAISRAVRPLLLRGGRMLVKRADGSLYYYCMAAGGRGGGVVMAKEEEVYKHYYGERCSLRITADVFVESLLPLRDILRT